MNSFVLTPGGISMLVNNKPFVVDASHINYNNILDAVRSKQWNQIEQLINVRKVLENKFMGSDLSITGTTVAFRGEPIAKTMTKHVLDLVEAGFSVSPLEAFLTKLYNNPSKKAIDELYTWISANGITISDDGFLIAYKRVQDDYTSVFDNRTPNNVGTYVEMPRHKVDDRSENTCSHGLHFCSQSYLPQYAGGIGRILLLKIDPADVVSIPTDYNNAKGRACKYWVEADLSREQQLVVEDYTSPKVLNQPVLVDLTDVNTTPMYKTGYTVGYKDGRGKQRKYKSLVTSKNGISTDYKVGYEAGFAEGKARKPKRFVI